MLGVTGIRRERHQVDKVYFISYFLIVTAKHAFVMGQGLNIANNLQGFSLEITRHRLYFLATLCCPSRIHGYLALLNQEMTDIDLIHVIVQHSSNTLFAVLLLGMYKGCWGYKT